VIAERVQREQGERSRSICEYCVNLTVRHNMRTILPLYMNMQLGERCARKQGLTCVRRQPLRRQSAQSP
jgi:hypothetical protein